MLPAMRFVPWRSLRLRLIVLLVLSVISVLTAATALELRLSTRLAERVTVRFSGLPRKAAIAERFAAEMFGVGIASLVSSFSGERPERVSFTYAPPPYQSEYARVFDFNVRGFVATSRLSDIRDILGGIVLIYESIQPSVTARTVAGAAASTAARSRCMAGSCAGCGLPCAASSKEVPTRSSSTVSRAGRTPSC